MTTSEQPAPLTYQEALTEHEFHYGQCSKTIGPRGGVTIRIECWRRNGQTKIWKTRPGEFKLPVKYGRRNYGSLTQHQAGYFHPASRCPLAERVTP